MCDSDRIINDLELYSFDECPSKSGDDSNFSPSNIDQCDIYWSICKMDIAEYSVTFIIAI